MVVRNDISSPVNNKTGSQTTLFMFTLRLVAAICIAFFAFLFVTVSSRVVGLVSDMLSGGLASPPAERPPNQ